MSKDVRNFLAWEYVLLIMMCLGLYYKWVLVLAIFWQVAFLALSIYLLKNPPASDE